MFDMAGVSVLQGLGSHWFLEKISGRWFATEVLLWCHLLPIVYCLTAFDDRDMYLEAIGYRGKNLRVIVYSSNEIQTELRGLMDLTKRGGYQD